MPPTSSRRSRRSSRSSRPGWRRAVHLGTGAVWLHQGLWSKVLGRDASHEAILGDLPGPIGAHAHGVTRALGAAESALALLVATNGRRRWVAGLETAVVVAFNAGGLLVGRDRIDHPGRLVVRNAAFLALAWSAVS